MLLSAIEIIKNILGEYSLEIVDIFKYGTSKIEFMVIRDDEIISISVINDLSYDFMILSNDGSKIIYSNTEKMTSINQLKELIYKDLDETLT